MIIDLPDTTASHVSKTLVRIRDEAGAVALGRVLTLLITSEIGEEEEVIVAANEASREHPMRIIVVSSTVPLRRRGSMPRSASAVMLGRARSSFSGRTATPRLTCAVS